MQTPNALSNQKSVIRQRSCSAPASISTSFFVTGWASFKSAPHSDPRTPLIRNRVCYLWNERLRRELMRMLWIEALINISAFAGFIGVANLGHKNRERKDD
jgi:hypothetical protein